MNGTTQLGPECFMDVDRKVINFQGENFYRACNRIVFNNPHGGVSHCILPAAFPHDTHVDSDGHRLGGQQVLQLGD